MFGLFSSKEVTQKAYDELLEYLTDHWKMKERYARAFLDTYRHNISKIHKTTSRLNSMMNSDDPELRLMSIASGGKQHALDLTLVTQAYQGYMTDLRRGRYVGTDTELAIWAILSNRSDLVEQFDKAFGGYINKKCEEKFPKLFDEVINMEL